MSKGTLRRWLSFFREDFPASERWKTMRGRVAADVRDDQLPDALLAKFDRKLGPGEAALAACLTFIAGAAIQAF